MFNAHQAVNKNEYIFFLFVLYINEIFLFKSMW